MLRATQVPPEFVKSLKYGIVTLYHVPFQKLPLNFQPIFFSKPCSLNLRLNERGLVEVLQPQPACRLVWALPCSLAATYGISSISLPLVTKMFQFTRCPSQDLCIQSWMTRHYPRRVSPFGYLRITPFVLVPGAFRRLHVLLRHLVPRHSPRTLCSF